MARNRIATVSLLLIVFALSLAEVVAAQSGSVYMVGFIKSPGKYTMPESGTLSVADALKLAGGVTDRGDVDQLAIIRKVDGKAVSSPVTIADLMRSDDTLAVGPFTSQPIVPGPDLPTAGAPSAAGSATAPQADKRFYVIGWVKVPGVYAFTEGLRVEGAIAKAGGVSRASSDVETQTFLHRFIAGKRAVTEAKPDILLRPDDVVEVRRLK